MSMEYPFVYIIVLNWNGKSYVENCFRSLERLNYPNYEVVMVDNASSDGSVEYIRKNFTWVKIIQNKENLGFIANNKGMKYALENGADYILLLNNDTIVDEKIINYLVETAEKDERIGAVGPKVLSSEQRDIIQEIGVGCDIFGFPFGIHSGEIDINQYVKPFDVLYCSACCLLLKRCVLEEIGYLDEKYFIFVDDLDLCWRAQLAGYRVVADPRAFLYHKSGGTVVGGYIKSDTYRTTTQRIYLRERNTLRTLLKNYSLMSLALILPAYLFLFLGEMLFFLLKDSKVSGNYLKALKWNIIHLKDTVRKRREIQRTRKRGDKEIMKLMYRGYGKLRAYKKIKTLQTE